MKQKNTLYTVILVFATLFTSWTVPALVRKMTDDSKSYPLLYYSARLKELCILDFREMKDAFKDIHGNVYPRTQYDSLLPLMNYRQLAMNGTLPDSLDGHALDVKVLRTKQVMFRFRPVDVFSPLPEMGVLLEAMPKRGKLTLPGDYFRMDAEGITLWMPRQTVPTRRRAGSLPRLSVIKDSSFLPRLFGGILPCARLMRKVIFVRTVKATFIT